MVPAPRVDGRSRSPRIGVVVLLAIGGVFTHLVLVVVLIAIFAAIIGIDTEPTASPPALTTTSPSSQATTPTTTTAAPPPQYTVTEVRSGDSLVVSDGTRSTTITVAGIDAPDLAAAQCWAAEAQRFAVDTLVGQKVDFGATPVTGATVPRLVLADGRDFAVLATAAGAVRAAAGTASAAIKEAEAAAKQAGLGLWGSPCLGELVAPPPVQPLVPAPPPAPAPPASPTGEPEPAPDVYFANCDAARAAGAAPLYRGEPGYRAGLDRDGDGVACER